MLIRLILGVCSIQWKKPIKKPRLPMAFLGQIEERDSNFTLFFIKDDKYVGLENLMALNVTLVM